MLTRKKSDAPSQIVAAINSCSLWTDMMSDACVPNLALLRTLTLSECLTAVQIVALRNHEAKKKGGPWRIYVVPSDSLVAAAYALAHFDTDDRPVAGAPIDEFRCRTLRVSEQELELGEGLVT